MEGDFWNYCTERLFDVVLCTHVIHFIEHSSMYSFVEKILNLLNDKAIIFISAYSKSKCESSDFCANKLKIENKQYQDRNKNIYYLLDNSDFESLLKLFSKTIRVNEEVWNKYANTFICFK